MGEDYGGDRRNMSISPMFTLKELADYLHVAPSTIHRMLRRGDGLPAFKVGVRDWRFNREAVDRWRLEQEKKWTDAKKSMRDSQQVSEK